MGNKADQDEILVFKVPIDLKEIGIKNMNMLSASVNMSLWTKLRGESGEFRFLDRPLKRCGNIQTTSLLLSCLCAAEHGATVVKLAGAGSERSKSLAVCCRALRHGGLGL